MPLDHTTSGVLPIAPTPFLPDGAVDWASAERLFAHYASIRADGATVLGIMGEAPKLEPDEAIGLLKRAVAALPGKPVIVGVSAPGFAPMRALARQSMEAGAAGVMISPAPGLRSDDQIAGYFRDATEAVGTDIPVVLQDYPQASGVFLAPGVIRRIIMENPSITVIKAEDWPSLEKVSALRRFQAEGSLRPLSILVANGGLFLDFEMERGADGSNTGYAFPELLIDVVRLSKAGQRDAAHDLFDAHLPLLRYEQQPGVGLAVRKYVMMRRGLLAHDAQRKPGSQLSATARAEVEYLLGRLARTDKRAAI